MTKEIIEMAQECGLIGMRPYIDGIYSEALVAFAKRVEEKALAEKSMRETQRLGQEIEQEPVADYIAARDMLDAQPVPPRTWIGLTDEEYTHITDTVFHTGQGLVAYYKAIEAKLKEKNT